jgi:hypothetical protein
MVRGQARHWVLVSGKTQDLALQKWHANSSRSDAQSSSNRRIAMIRSDWIAANHAVDASTSVDFSVESAAKLDIPQGQMNADL